MKLLTINYLPFNNWRKDYYKLAFYFLNKIKDDNKKKIFLHIAIQKGEEKIWEDRIKELDDIDVEIIGYDNGQNYLKKLYYGINKNTKYSIKMDEDIFINNYILDYMIDNIEELDNEDNLMMTTILSNNIPGIDLFIEGAFDEESKKVIYSYFLQRYMPDGLWSNYSSLNKHTIHAEEWNANGYYDDLRRLPTNFKGMHPIRISWEAEFFLNNFILENIDIIKNKNDYSIMKKSYPYFTNSFFAIKTKVWKDIIENHRLGDSFDEVGINKYMRDNNKSILFIRNSYSIHTMFNTIQGSGNRWGIGNDSGREKELEFFYKLLEKIID
jgi:hypothetical protein